MVGEGVGGGVPDGVAGVPVDAAGCGGRGEAEDGELKSVFQRLTWFSGQFD